MDFVTLCNEVAGGRGAAAHGSPARAGIDLSLRRRRSFGLRFPRTRGDRPTEVDLGILLIAWSVPPHARG